MRSLVSKELENEEDVQKRWRILIGLVKVVNDPTASSK